jgi:superfamily II DNA or RNA helicase
MQAPTGSGKTYLFTEMAKNAAKKRLNVWIVVPRNELLQQASDHLFGAGVAHGLIAAGTMESRAYNVHVVSKDTLIRRFDKIKRPPDFMIVDEAHLALDRYLEIAGRYPNAKILGVTATPERLDGRGLSELYQAHVQGPSLGDMVERGDLSNLRYFCPPIEGLDDIKRTGTEYNQNGLEALLTVRKVYGEAISHYRRHADHKPCLVFCRSVKAATKTAQEFSAAGYKFENIDGTMAYKKRKALIGGLKTGELDGLTSCELITYGLDVPRVECVIMLRPTLSRTLYFQMIGRGLRNYPGKKELVVLDHVGNLQEHGHPLAPYEWQFDGVEKRKREKADPEIIARLCPHIDFLYCDKPSCAGCPHSDGGKDPRPPVQIDTDLVEADSPVKMVDRDPSERDIIEGNIHGAIADFRAAETVGEFNAGAVGVLLKIAIDTGRQPLWVYWELSRERVTVNVPLLHEISRQRKYKRGWTNFAVKSIEKRMENRR